MEFNWQVNNYDYRNRSGNLTSEAQGKVKSKKYFPTFSVDGKEIVFNLYDESYNRLVDNGELYIVIQKKQGKDSSFKHLEQLFNKVEIINKDKGYYIIKSVK